jgi:hypothetical protein
MKFDRSEWKELSRFWQTLFEASKVSSILISFPTRG